MGDILPRTLFEKENPKYADMWERYSDELSGSTGDRMVHILRSAGLRSELDTEIKYDPNENIFDNIYKKCHPNNPHSEKAARVAMSKVHLKDGLDGNSRLYFRAIRARLPDYLADLTGSSIYLHGHLLFVADVNRFSELKAIFGKNVHLHLESFAAYGVSKCVHLLTRSMIVMDHFVDRFAERVLPNEYFTRYSEKEAALAEFLTCGPKYWGKRREYAYAVHKETSTMVEVFKVEGMPMVYFFGYGRPALVENVSATSSLFTTLSGFNITCMTENELTPKRKSDLKMLGFTEEDWEEKGKLKVSGWIKKSPEVLISEGKPHGRK